MRISKVTFAVLLLASMLVACATTGPGGKKSLIIIPTSQEVAIGAGMAQQVEQTEKVLADPAWQAYLNEVGQKIVAVSDRKDIEYHFTVIESDQVNAFAAPGGYIYFYTGLLREMDNEAEMAAVVAHEISHVVARHGIKRLQTSLGVAAAYELVFGEDGAGDVLNVAIGLGMNLAFADYSRENEREADAFGIIYMTEAGYNPRGALGMFDKLAALSGGDGGTSVFENLARSHPQTQERIANAERQIQEMGQLPGNLVLNETKYQQMLRRLPPKQAP